MSWDHEINLWGWEIGFGYNLREWGIGFSVSCEWCLFSMKFEAGPFYIDISRWR